MNFFHIGAPTRSSAGRIPTNPFRADLDVPRGPVHVVHLPHGVHDAAKLRQRPRILIHAANLLDEQLADRRGEQLGYRTRVDACVVDGSVGVDRACSASGCCRQAASTGLPPLRWISLRREIIPARGGSRRSARVRERGRSDGRRGTRSEGLHDKRFDAFGRRASRGMERYAERSSATCPARRSLMPVHISVTSLPLDGAGFFLTRRLRGDVTVDP